MFPVSEDSAEAAGALQWPLCAGENEVALSDLATEVTSAVFTGESLGKRTQLPPFRGGRNKEFVEKFFKCCK